MNRFHIAQRHWQPDALALDPAEARHATQVLRLRAGDRLVVFTDDGTWAEAKIATITRAGATLETLAVHESPPAGARLELAVAVPKGRTIEWIIEKAVELGATAVRPMLTARTVARLDRSEAADRGGKWRKVAIEACKQCGQNRPPVIHDPQEFDEAIEACQAGGFDLALIGSLEPGSRTIREAVADFREAHRHAPASALIVIGPEGDFTPQEYVRARESGLRPVTFGGITLRVETAALFAMSVLKYELTPA